MSPAEILVGALPCPCVVFVAKTFYSRPVGVAILFPVASMVPATETYSSKAPALMSRISNDDVAKQKVPILYGFVPSSVSQSLSQASLSSTNATETADKQEKNRRIDVISHLCFLMSKLAHTAGAYPGFYRTDEAN